MSRKELLEKISEILSEKKFHQIATVNPEFILTAQKDPGFREILNACDLNIADGAGISLAFRLRGEKLKIRMAGADLMEEVFKIAEKNDLKIFLATNSSGLSTWEETAAAIKKRYPDLRIGGADLKKKTTGYEIPDYGFAILLCNFGSPEQEKFIKDIKNDSINLAIGVGGSFDYLTGKIRRAPVFMRKCGLEWFWRLLQQPKRIKRIWNAVIVFPIKIIFCK